MPQKLTREALVSLAQAFCAFQSKAPHPELFGVTDGKAVGTHVEHLFQALVLDKYDISAGSSARGIDLPTLNTDIKVTSIKQPQSSCPFKSAREKVFGLSYDLLLFVYDKKDDSHQQAAFLNFVCCALIEKHRTADYQTTRGLQGILGRFSTFLLALIRLFGWHCPRAARSFPSLARAPICSRLYLYNWQMASR